MARKKKDDNNVDELDYKEIHDNDFKELATPPVEEVVEEKEEEKVEEPKKEEVKSPLDEAKELLEKQKEEQKLRDEELRKEIDEIKNSKLTKEEKKDKEEEVKAKYKWEEENRTPKDYNEIAQEAEERAFERAKKFFEEKEKEKAEETEKQRVEREEKEKKQKEDHDAYLKSVDDKITADLEELYEGKFIPRPIDEKDPEDEGVKARNDIFKQAMEFNQQRIKEGKPIIDSPAKFYFLHYKKTEKMPAGADAPVAGATTTSTVEKVDEYNYAEDHKKSFRQIAADVAKKVTGRG